MQLFMLLVSSLAATADPVDLDEPVAEVPRREEAPPIATAKPLRPETDVLSHAVVGPDGRWSLGADRLTIDPWLQRQLSDILASFQAPWAAIVVLEPATGRVLAMAEHSERAPGFRGLCTGALFPAASLFKIVTASALLEAGVGPREMSCFHGGKRKVSEELLEDSVADSRCLTLEEAMGRSANVVFAKLTARYLDPERLTRLAKAFKFNSPFPFPVPTDVSLAAIPSETSELASTGAGFGDVYLSPLHAAAVVSVAANRGVWRWPVLFEKDVGGRLVDPVLEPAQADALVEMLAFTVTEGTARRYFSPPRYHFEAVGKTGSLSDKRPVFRDYSWFVGFAPKQAPRVAVAAVIVNEPVWKIRAAWLGAEALRLSMPRSINAAVKESVNP